MKAKLVGGHTPERITIPVLSDDGWFDEHQYVRGEFDNHDMVEYHFDTVVQGWRPDPDAPDEFEDSPYFYCLATFATDS